LVEVDLDAAVSAMPVVTGRLPSGGWSEPGPELLLSAHLCHPRPGANDNASGVAALLGIARVLVKGRWGSGSGLAQQPGAAAPASRGAAGVRFLWGPEFVGTAAYLREVVGTGLAAAPALAINIDMAGQDVARCGGPLVIERGPDDVGSFLPALAVRCAALLPPASRSYSGAVPCDPWTWRATPFAGGSDHGLIADLAGGLPGDRAARCQVVGLGHWPDRANHSSADTPALVDPAELRRTAVIAAAMVAVALGNGDSRLATDVGEATVSWAAEHVLAVLPGRRARPAHRADWPDEPVLDPHAEANAVRWLRHRGAVARGAVGALAAVRADAEWLRSALAWVDSVVESAAARLPEEPSPAHGQDDAGGCGSGSALVRCWAGPANLRALAEDAEPADREWLNARLAADRGGNYTRALALMQGINGERSLGELAWWAALSSELAMPVNFAETFVDLLSRAGWARASGGQA